MYFSSVLAKKVKITTFSSSAVLKLFAVSLLSHSKAVEYRMCLRWRCILIFEKLKLVDMFVLTYRSHYLAAKYLRGIDKLFMEAILSKMILSDHYVKKKPMQLARPEIPILYRGFAVLSPR